MNQRKCDDLTHQDSRCPCVNGDGRKHIEHKLVDNTPNAPKLFEALRNTYNQ